jgi:hypothetical protein
MYHDGNIHLLHMRYNCVFISIEWKTIRIWYQHWMFEFWFIIWHPPHYIYQCYFHICVSMCLFDVEICLYSKIIEKNEFILYFLILVMVCHFLHFLWKKFRCRCFLSFNIVDVDVSGDSIVFVFYVDFFNNVLNTSFH